MMPAYQEMYLSRAQQVVGEVFEFGINHFNISGKLFLQMFVVSSASKRLEVGEPSYIAGKSGKDIAYEIINETYGKMIMEDKGDYITNSIEYWIGWAVAYYQWYSSRKYSEIFQVVSYEDLLRMYYTLHEADITKFVEVLNEKIKEFFLETNLKRIRLVANITQLELSKRSGVSLRSIQMYEQRNKDINKASIETVYKLARTLGCTMEDLIEKKV